MSAAPGARFVAWRFSDARPGHDNQSIGLLEALAAAVPLAVHAVPVGGRPAWLAAAGILARRGAPAGGPPDLLVGAGHATHLPMLAARRRHGGRAVVLMSPSLPLRWFDLCIAPAHDGLEPGARVLVTRGAPSRVRPSAHHDPGRGLVLVGGPSRHHGFDADALLEQIAALTADAGGRRWQVADSRRTPPGFLARVAACGHPNVRTAAHRDVGPDWLRDALAAAGIAWVTEDSVSMVYESLTSGAVTGVLPMPRRERRTSRVQAGLDALVAEGWVNRFDAWRAGAALAPPPRALDEAGRCARWIADRWLRPGG